MLDLRQPHPQGAGARAAIPRQLALPQGNDLLHPQVEDVIHGKTT